MSRCFVAVTLTTLVLTAIAPAGWSAEKKPVTLDAIDALRKAAGAPLSSPKWSPKGGRFLYRNGDKLMLYDVSSKSEKEVLSFPALEAAAVKPPADGRFAWQNRRVRESQFSWSESGDEVLIAAEGDLFLWHERTGKWDQLTATAEEESDAKLSPDGTMVAYRLDDDLYCLDVASKKPARLTFDGAPALMNGKLDWVYPEELDLGEAFWWSPDSRRLAYMQFDTGHEFIYPQADLLARRALAEPERYPQAGTPNADVRVGLVSVKDAQPKTHWLDLGETRGSLVARVDWLPDSSAVAIQRLNRVQNHLDLLRADATSGTVTTLLSESDAYWINMSDCYEFLANGDFVWSSERDGFRHLYLYAANGELKNRITSGAWEVTELAGVDETHRKIYYSSTEASPLERQLYVIGFDASGKQRITQGAGTHLAEMSPKCDYFLDRYSTIADPPSTTLRDATGAEVTLLRPAVRKPYEQYDILPAEFVEVPSESGVKFYASLIKPKDFQPGRKYPLIVMVYGGPDAQSVVNAWRGVGLAQVLATKGFLVWQLDNRGSTGRGHAFETPLYHRFGKTELADQLEGIRYLEKLGNVDPDRIGITGWSYGGYMTLYSLLNAPKVFKIGIAGAPVTDWHNYDTIYTERYLGLPDVNPSGYKDGSAITYASQLQSKLLIVHNIEDDNVLFQNTMQMADALEKAGKDFRMIVYPQKMHGVIGKASRQMYEAWLEEFDETLRP